jgi:hypothetical protein
MISGGLTELKTRLRRTLEIMETGPVGMITSRRYAYVFVLKTQVPDSIFPERLRIQALTRSFFTSPQGSTRADLF